MKRLFLLATVISVLSVASCNKADKNVVVRLDTNELELEKGSEKQLKASVIPNVENPELQWFSSNPEYVSVSADGVVKAHKIYYKNTTDTDASSVSIYCRYQGGADECKVFVTPLGLKSIEFDIEGWEMGSALALDPKETVTVVARPVPADADVDAEDLKWATDGFLYADVQQDEKDPYKAVITGVWPGSVSISLTYGRVSSEIRCIVSPIPATSVTIDGQENITMEVGEVCTLSASFLPADATVSLEWLTSDNKVAVVKDGKITAKAPGTATITVKAGKVSDTVTVVVEGEEENTDGE
jgi:uncharacterized protein YjdB